MRHIVVLGLVAGVALLTALIVHYGVGAILHSIATLGWDGFAAVIACHLLLIATLGVAWWLLASGRPEARPARFVWGRLMREAAAEALPFSQIGGFVLGARAVTLAGVPSALAAASTVVDVTVEMVAQLGYTLLGLALLARVQPESRLLGPIVGGLLVMTLLAATFVAVQARGVAFVERALSRLAESWLGVSNSRASLVGAAIRAIHKRAGILTIATFAHLGSWLLNGVEAWITLELMGVDLPIADVLIIDSLLYGLRSAAFFVPNAVGVQEGGYVMLGALFGLPPDIALALSLIRRGRDLVIGIPSLLAWQVLEGRRALLGAAPKPAVSVLEKPG